MVLPLRPLGSEPLRILEPQLEDSLEGDGGVMGGVMGGGSAASEESHK